MRVNSPMLNLWVKLKHLEVRDDDEIKNKNIKQMYDAEDTKTNDKIYYEILQV